MIIHYHPRIVRIISSFSQSNLGLAQIYEGSTDGNGDVVGGKENNFSIANKYF
jgi:hypothetical protein